MPEPDGPNLSPEEELAKLKAREKELDEEITRLEALERDAAGVEGRTEPVPGAEPELDPVEEETPAESTQPPVGEAPPKIKEPVPVGEKPPKDEGDDAQQVGSALLDQLKQETLKEQAGLELEKVQANIKIAKNEKWDTRPLESALEQMNAAIDKKDFAAAVKIGVKANKEAKPPAADHVDPDQVENTIERLEVFVKKAPSILDTAEAKELLIKARAAFSEGDNSTALKHAKECKANLKEKGDTVNLIKANLKTATVNMGKNKMAGKDTAVTEELIRKAKAALKALDYKQAVRHSQDALAKSEG